MRLGLVTITIMMPSILLRLISRRVAPPSRRLLSPPTNFFSTATHRELLRRPSSPWLMLPPYFMKGGSDMVYNFYSPITGKVESFNNRGGKEETDLMRDDLTHLIGSSHGWLALFNSGSRRMFLSNPISGRRIELPPLTELITTKKVDLRCPRKAIISSSPEVKDCCALVILNTKGRVAFCWPGHGGDDAEWAPLGKWNKDPILNISRCRHHRDFVHSASRQTFFGSSLSDCCRHEELEGWDLTGPLGPRKVRLDRLGKDDREYGMYFGSNTYVVRGEPSDETFIVRSYFLYKGTVDDFDVYGMDFDVFRVGEGGGGRERCSSLGDVAMFVGINHSFAVKASEYPGLKPNCIYFSDCNRHCNNGQFICVFDYETKTASPLYYDSIKLQDRTPHPWFTPALD